MNYLAHLHLGGDQPAQLLGSLYGDFVKGPLDGRWPADIEAGIRLHRRIDVFTDAHPLTAEAKALFPASRRRVASILLDLFFDHCLARDWRRYAEVPLPAFTGQVYRVLAEEPALPERLAFIAPRMAAQDWLGSYQDFAIIEQVLAGMSRRFSRPGLLDGAYEEIEQLYQPLSETFRRFYPELQGFAREASRPA
ncbi:ACP phosphodiesterase [Pseudomonas sp. zfem005]|uniref:acyl carrier protein phosphodiesterase n=1 Tax=Pseudomonas sp. zfem005 TaxID=3078200 RepID=UPI00292974AF|nr:ACP phosphodiesterase [Pseudomonas sp. zfem005]MDU9415424.1 ACP phosphodiesterase [Pseudomonas sp. zfem005]